MVTAANIARPLPANLYPNIAAPAVTIVQGIPRNSAQGFASIQSQLVNATTVLTPPMNISRINSIKIVELMK